MTKRIISILILLKIQLFLGSCGFLDGGSSSSSLNESAPDGTILAQGSFTGANGQTVTGNAFIYFIGLGSYAVRVTSLSTPDETSLQIVVTANGVDVTTQSLRANSGNQNYYFSTSNISTWTSVSVRKSTVTAPDNEYGTALLTTVNTN